MKGNVSVNLTAALFLLYCAFALYSSVVAFIRPGEVGAAIFRDLRIPIVVFLYFLVPCVALYFIYRAFWLVHPPLFWSAFVLVGPLSFFIILYLVTSPDWPVGKMLQVSRVPTDVMRVLLSLNFALSFLAGGAGAITVYAVPGKITRGPRASEFQQASQSLEKLDNEAAQKQTEVQSIKREAVSSVFKEWGDIVKVVLTFITTLLTFAVSMMALKKK
jgi:hypothetical protein